MNDLEMPTRLKAKYIRVRRKDGKKFYVPVIDGEPRMDFLCDKASEAVDCIRRVAEDSEYVYRNRVQRRQDEIMEARKEVEMGSIPELPDDWENPFPGAPA